MAEIVVDEFLLTPPSTAREATDPPAEPVVAVPPETPTAGNIALVKKVFQEVLHADGFVSRQMLRLVLSDIMLSGAAVDTVLDLVPQGDAPEGKVSLDTFLRFLFRGVECGPEPSEPEETNVSDIECSPSRGSPVLLLEAARCGDEAGLKAALGLLGLAASRGRSGGSATVLAASGGHESCLRLMLDRDADPQARDNQGKSAIIAAAKGGHLDCIRLLAERRADLEARDDTGRTAVIQATIAGHRDALALLADLSADLEAKEPTRNSTAVIFAASHGRESCMTFLTERGVNLEVKMTGCATGKEVIEEGSTAVCMAATNGHVGCVRVLADNGADLNARLATGTSPAMLAAHQGHEETLNLLAERKADLTIHDTKFRTAAMHAAFGGHRDCLRVLAWHGVDMEAANSSILNSSVAMAFLMGQGDLLFGAGLAAVRERRDTSAIIAVANPQDAAWPPTPATHREAENRLALLEAATIGDDSRMRRLLVSGVTPAARTSGVGKTAAILACEHGHAKCLQVILQHKGDPDWQDRHGNTAAIAAARFGSEGCLRVLMEWQDPFDPELRDSYGHTALNSAARCGYASCLQILLEVCSNVDAQENKGQTPAIQAAQNNHYECLALLIEWKANLAQRTHGDGVTALSVAAGAGHERCIRLLVENGADLLEKDGRGRRPVELIARSSPGLLQSLLPSIDWLEAAEKGPDELHARLLPQHGLGVDGIVGKVPWSKRALASLHSSIWSGAGVCREGSDLARKLAEQTRGYVCSAGERRISAADRELMKVLLGLGVLAADDLGRSATENAVRQALAQLFEACERRQAELGAVAESTSQVDTVFPHPNFQGDITTEPLDQRDAMPESTWSWLLKPRPSCFERLHSAYEGFRSAGAATNTGEFARFLQAKGLTKDAMLVAVGAVDLLESYAKLVNDGFVEFMQEHFEEAFKTAPVKSKARMIEKVTTDLLETLPGFSGFDSVEGVKEAAGDERIRNSFFTLGDVVRGSIVADGAEEMLAVLDKLKTFGAAHHDISVGSPTFDVWRVKNTHHPDAVTVGGYRDMKVLGRFRQPPASAHSMCKTWPGSLGSKRSQSWRHTQPALCMIVEIQIIDVQFLAIKKFMHKVYAIERGDYWEH
eukprot:TRINITY_DN33799_c0_g1_i1.p1 TRINITY_DN33799_c0_g1~~TRINITY_DN33799_c0_g1_i1.p1  ORF type:complete len:1122 (+),score=207.76 TRINITY_DN33799_c0_g1_i1:188-3553(+)